MKFDRNTIAPLALALALAACGGASEEAEDVAASVAPEATETEAVPADAVTGEATPQGETEEVAAEEATETPTPAPTPAPSKAAEPSPAPVAAVAPAEPPQAFVQCSVCHSTKPDDNGIGPSLAGIYGTKAAEVEGFKFSPAMKESGLTWDDATLDTYLKDPRKVVPGTIMGFGGVKDDAKRKAIIEYLKTL